MSYGHTAFYTHIDEALRSQWEPFCQLEREMAEFIPKPIEEYKSKRDNEVERLQRLNPQKPVEELTKLVDEQIQFVASTMWQFHERFDQRHMTKYVTVVMLSHALCEALINAVLAIGLASKDSAELFSIIEKADFKKKWLVGPKSFSLNYKFPFGTGMHETLSMLIRDRNALMHHKIELEVNGKKVLEGSRFERKQFDKEQRVIRRYFSLPYDLATFVRNATGGASGMLLFDRGPIAVASEHIIV